MIGVDLFSGAGGMSLGAQQAGVDVRFAVESCPYACQTYRANFPDTSLYEGDIRTVAKLPSRKRDEESVLFGGPPCQGFSTSNQRTRGMANPDNLMFREFTRLVKVWRPTWVVLENVKGVVETEGGFFIEEASDILGKLGYETHFALLNAYDFGVPQNRTRAFLVGCRDNQPFQFPTPKRRRTTVRMALSDLPDLENGANDDKGEYGKAASFAYAKQLRGARKHVTGNLVTRNADYILKRYEHVPQGGNWEAIPGRLMRNYKDRLRCHTGIYRRLDPDKPSCVIGNFRKNMLIHPWDDRGLSIREAARIQSVPDKFVFQGSIGFQQQQVGNMVPALLAKAVFEQVSVP